MGNICGDGLVNSLERDGSLEIGSKWTHCLVHYSTHNQYKRNFGYYLYFHVWQKQNGDRKDEFRGSKQSKQRFDEKNDSVASNRLQGMIENGKIMLQKLYLIL